MKKIICILCSLAIILVCIGGCGTAGGNPFTAENAVKGQVGDLYYVVPENAVLDESSIDESNVYRVPIANSNEEYTLSIACSYLDEEAYETSVQYWENLKGILSSASTEYAEQGSFYEEQDITSFLGKTVDYGSKITVEGNGQKMVSAFVITSNKVCGVTYSAKTGFYDQAVWDNFYAQLKFV